MLSSTRKFLSFFFSFFLFFFFRGGGEGGSDRGQEVFQLREGWINRFCKCFCSTYEVKTIKLENRCWIFTFFFFFFTFYKFSLIYPSAASSLGTSDNFTNSEFHIQIYDCQLCTHLRVGLLKRPSCVLFSDFCLCHVGLCALATVSALS